MVKMTKERAQKCAERLIASIDGRYGMLEIDSNWEADIELEKKGGTIGIVRLYERIEESDPVIFSHQYMTACKAEDIAAPMQAWINRCIGEWEEQGLIENE